VLTVHRASNRACRAPPPWRCIQQTRRQLAALHYRIIHQCILPHLARHLTVLAVALPQKPQYHGGGNRLGFAHHLDCAHRQWQTWEACYEFDRRQGGDTPAGGHPQNYSHIPVKAALSVGGWHHLHHACQRVDQSSIWETDWSCVSWLLLTRCRILQLSPHAA